MNKGLILIDWEKHRIYIDGEMIYEQQNIKRKYTKMELEFLNIQHKHKTQKDKNND